MVSFFFQQAELVCDINYFFNCHAFKEVNSSALVSYLWKIQSASARNSVLLENITLFQHELNTICGFGKSSSLLNNVEVWRFPVSVPGTLSWSNTTGIKCCTCHTTEENFELTWSQQSILPVSPFPKANSPTPLAQAFSSPDPCIYENTTSALCAAWKQWFLLVVLHTSQSTLWYSFGERQSGLSRAPVQYRSPLPPTYNHIKQKLLSDTQQHPPFFLAQSSHTFPSTLWQPWAHESPSLQFRSLV